MEAFQDTPVERHPWKPYLPLGAKILVLGTFPPGRQRRSMEFYYPNRMNDFWRMASLVFFSDKDRLTDPVTGGFDLEGIKSLLGQRKIALGDTALEVRRRRGNASDKFLEILKPLPLIGLLDEMPDCLAVASTGEKAASVISQITGTPLPKPGGSVEFAMTAGRLVRIYRMPSTSRAYPLALEKKAEYYRRMFSELGIL